jgi:hypothetical protein
LPYDHSEDVCDSQFHSENLSSTLSWAYSEKSVDSFTTYYETDFETEDEVKPCPNTESQKKYATSCETDFRTEDELKSNPVIKSQMKKEAVYGHIPGKKMDSSHFDFQKFSGYRYTVEISEFWLSNC